MQDDPIQWWEQQGRNEWQNIINKFEDELKESENERKDALPESV